MVLRSSSESIESTLSHVIIIITFFRIFRWGSTYHVYSSLRVWLAYDGTFVEVIPAPSAKGQHCGICGNYNRNKVCNHATSYLLLDCSWSFFSV